MTTDSVSRHFPNSDSHVASGKPRQPGVFSTSTQLQPLITRENSQVQCHSGGLGCNGPGGQREMTCTEPLL